MVEIELILGYPPTVNSYYVKTRNGVFISGKGKEYRKDVAQNVDEQVGNLNLDVPLCVELFVFPPDRRKRDLDNVCKSLLDSLTHANVWTDDSLINQLLMYRGKRVENGVIVVKINEAAPLIPYRLRIVV